MGIMHRDIKSSNIFLFSNKTAKLGDLNVCKILSNDILGYTQTGTPAYAAPEVWMEKPYGLKSDIWSLGCVLYEMITLQCPFEENTIVKLYNKVLLGEYKKIPNIFSNELNWAIEQMINTDINKRFSCDELLNCDCVQRHLDKYNRNLNIKSHSEKKVNQYKNISRINNRSCFKNNTIHEKKEDDGELLKTIYMPDHFLYLKDQLPKSNYIDKIKRNKVHKNTVLCQNNPEDNNLTNKKEENISNNNTINDLLILKRNPHQHNSFQQRNYNNNIILFNKNKENNGKIKLKHIKSVLNPNDINANKNNYYSSSLGNINISLKKIGKSDGNFSNKIKDYLYIYQREKEQQNQSIIGRNVKEKKFDMKNALFISSDKLKEMFKSNKTKEIHLLYHKDSHINKKLKSIENMYIENNRYNDNSDHNDISNEKNRNLIRSNENEIKHNIFLIHNGKKGYNNIITNKVINNINNIIYSNELFNKTKKKSVDLLPRIKLSYA
jgi:hypothetical protein